MNTEHEIDRIRKTLGTFIAWSATELGSHNVAQLLNMLSAPEEETYNGVPEDPNCLEAPPRTPEEMAQNAGELDAVAPTPADKFTLMLTMNQQARMADLLNRFANHLSACLNTYPSLRTEEHDAIFKEYRNIKP